MLKRSEKLKLEKKEREWDKALQDFDIFYGKVKKELALDFKNMINWLLFYKPDGTGDKILHIVEVVAVWIFLTKLVFGI